MAPNQLLEDLRKAATQALTTHRELFEIWRDLPVEDAAQSCSQTDVKLLCELMKYRIYPANAFELLARVDIDAAIEALLDRYLGEFVCPDTKFGGFSFELATMLGDLVDIAGPDTLRQLLRREGFGQKHLKDRRVIEAFSEALDIDGKQWETWLKSNLPEAVSAKAS